MLEQGIARLFAADPAALYARLAAAKRDAWLARAWQMGRDFYNEEGHDPLPEWDAPELQTVQPVQINGCQALLLTVQQYTEHRAIGKWQDAPAMAVLLQPAAAGNESNDYVLFLSTAVRYPGHGRENRKGPVMGSIAEIRASGRGTAYIYEHSEAATLAVIEAILTGRFATLPNEGEISRTPPVYRPD